jgi:hypothetical protein
MRSGGSAEWLAAFGRTWSGRRWRQVEQARRLAERADDRAEADHRGQRR